MQYVMIIEKGERNYSAYFPDLPGCIATGRTLEELKQHMREALELHLRGMREDGLPIPQPSLVDYVEAAQPGKANCGCGPTNTESERVATGSHAFLMGQTNPVANTICRSSDDIALPRVGIRRPRAYSHVLAVYFHPNFSHSTPVSVVWLVPKHILPA